MIITVDPSQSEDIAAFAMVKQYRLQALNVTLNGGTGVSAWQAVQGGEGYTQTVVTPVTGIELVYEDPNAIVSYTVENDDTSNYDAASDAGIILSSIEPTTNAWTYTCVFHADSAPVSSIDIDLLVYGNVARGTEQQGSPATAEEITAQVLAGLETRVLALETEMPTKADVATTYTKTEIDNAVVHKAGAETIDGVKTFTSEIFGRIYSNKSVHMYDGTANWYKVFSISTTERQQHILEVDYIDNVRNVTGEGRMLISHAGGENVCKFINYYANPTSYIVPGNIALCVGSSSIDIWAKRSSIHHIHIGIIKSLIGSNAIFMPENKIVATYDSTQGQASIPETDYSTVVYGTDISSNYVHTSGDETIQGVKTFTNTLTQRGSTSEAVRIINTNLPSDRTQRGTMSQQVQYQVTNTQTAGNIFMSLEMVDTATYRTANLNLFCPGGVGWEVFCLRNDSTGTYMQGPNRPYSAGNTRDVATIGTLDAYSPMVRTTGNQTITGVKTIQTSINSALEIKTNIPDLEATPTGYPARDIVWTCNDNGPICRLRFQVSPTGERQLVGFMTDKDGTAHAKILMSMTIDGVVQ